jgi:hypothetical protein
MKKSSLIVFLALVFQVTAQAQTNSSKQATLEIHQLIQESFDSLFSGYQANLVERYYTPDFILLEQGEVWDMDLFYTGWGAFGLVIYLVSDLMVR